MDRVKVHRSHISTKRARQRGWTRPLPKAIKRLAAEEQIKELEGKIKEMEGKIVAVCMACPHAKWQTGRFQCQVSRRHCHSKRVRRWLDEIKRLEKEK